MTNAETWGRYLSNVDVGPAFRALNIKLEARPAEARDGVEVRASMLVPDRDNTSRVVPAIVTDFPPAIDGLVTNEDAALFVRAIIAKLLVHEVNESLRIGGYIPFNPHTDLPR